MLSSLVFASVIVSLNPCFDDWVPQWLAADVTFLPTTTHGQRLEAIVQKQPDIVLAGSFVGRALRIALEQRVSVVTVPYVTSVAEWDQALSELAQTLDHETQLERWREAQQRQLERIDLSALGQTLVLIPNAYTWGRDSWVAALLSQQGARLSPLMADGELLRLSLESVLMSSPDTVILEGFSTAYARAHDWLWHDAVQHWLAQRKVLEVSGDIAGCADSRAVDYVQSLTQAVGEQR